MSRPFPILDNADWLRREYVDNDRVAQDIAAEIGCTTAAVLTAAKQHGIPIRPAIRTRVLAHLTDEDIRRAVTGRSLRAACAELGVAYLTLRNEMRVRRIDHVQHEPLRDPVWQTFPPLTDRAQVEAWVHGGWSLRQIARAVGCSVYAVESAIDAHAITAPPGLVIRGNPEATAHLNDHAWLRDTYESQGVSARAIAGLLHTSEATVGAALDAAGISRRPWPPPPKPLPPRKTRPAARSVVGLDEANRRRSAQAARRVSRQATRVLEGRHHDTTTAEILALRVAFPAASLAELAARLGMTKDAYAARLRRAIRGAR